MGYEGYEFAESQLEEDDEYCAVCHAVYATAEGCSCAEHRVGRTIGLDAARS